MADANKNIDINYEAEGIEIPDEILNLPEKGSSTSPNKKAKKKSPSKNADTPKIGKSGMLRNSILITVIPMLLLALATGIAAYNLSLTNLLKAKQREMDSIAKLSVEYIDTLIPGDYVLQGDSAFDLYKGDTVITMDYALVDNISAMSGMETSLIYKDTRILTTVTDKNGARVVGSGIVTQVKEKLFRADAGVFFKDTLISGNGYYAYYLPIKNANGEYAGALELCCPHSTLTPLVWKTTCPVVLLVLVFMIIIIVLVYTNYSSIVTSFRNLLAFTTDAASGNDAAELDMSLLRRNDEIGSIASSVLDMHRSLRDMMDKDALTKLYNRRSANRKLDIIHSHYTQQGTPYSLSIGDIDFFKKVNDTYGHDAGDLVLKEVAAILGNHMKNCGFVARWGGEEFLLVFDKTELSGAVARLDKILDEIRNLAIDYNGQTIKITMSFGVVCNPELNRDEIITKADECLYYSKEHGRNRITSEIL